MSDEIKDLITKLLDKDPKTRLGSTTDADEVVTHAWFRDLDWEGLMNKTIDLPFKPDMDKIKNKKVDEFDTFEEVRSLQSFINIIHVYLFLLCSVGTFGMW